MALLSFDEEMDRSRPCIPFSNGYEFDNWYSIWCQECRFEDACPLLLVALHEVTPGPWEDRNPGALNRYHCTEFERIPDEAPSVQAEDAP
jgi:hypothetical protein